MMIDTLEGLLGFPQDLLEEVVVVVCNKCCNATLAHAIKEAIAPIGIIVYASSLRAEHYVSIRRLQSAHAVIGLSGCEDDCVFQIATPFRHLEVPLRKDEFSLDSMLVQHVVDKLASLLRWENEAEDGELVELDCRGQLCPMPIIKLSKTAEGLAPGQRLRVFATDPTFPADVNSWSQQRGFTLEHITNENGVIVAILRKRPATAQIAPPVVAHALPPVVMPVAAAAAAEQLDCVGLSCPMPIIKLSKKAREMPGGTLEVLADDPAFPSDVQAWANRAGATVEVLDQNGKVFRALIELSSKETTTSAPAARAMTPSPSRAPSVQLPALTPSVFSSPPPTPAPASFPLSTREERAEFAPPSAVTILERLDCKGMRSPLPIVSLQKALKRAQEPGLLIVEAQDPQFRIDIENWCGQTGCELLQFEDNGGVQRAIVSVQPATPQPEPEPDELIFAAPSFEHFASASLEPAISAPQSAPAQLSREALHYEGLRCPMPILKLNQTIRKSNTTAFEVFADDPAFEADLRAWCEQNEFLVESVHREAGVIRALIQSKNAPAPSLAPATSSGVQKPLPTLRSIPTLQQPSSSSSSSSFSPPSVSTFRKPPAPTASAPSAPSMTASLPVELDFLGLKCPMPIVKLAKASRKHAGKSLIVRADDPAFPADLKVWCEQTGMAIANLECEGKVYTATLEPQGES